MLITTAAILIAVGFAFVVFGQLFGYYELGVIGGVIILGVGAIAVGGIEEQVGETEIQVDNSTTETEIQTESIAEPQHLSMGAMIMLVGGTIVLRSFEAFAESER